MVIGVSTEIGGSGGTTMGGGGRMVKRESAEGGTDHENEGRRSSCFGSSQYIKAAWDETRTFIHSFDRVLQPRFRRLKRF